eukprot:4851569-Pleurochrysis_carterae.AAC.1
MPSTVLTLGSPIPIAGAATERSKQLMQADSRRTSHGSVQQRELQSMELQTTELCADTCEGNPHFAFDGDCDDGGPGSEFNLCSFGTDCKDCTSRSPSPPPP